MVRAGGADGAPLPFSARRKELSGLLSRDPPLCSALDYECRRCECISRCNAAMGHQAACQSSACTAVAKADLACQIGRSILAGRHTLYVRSAPTCVPPLVCVCSSLRLAGCKQLPIAAAGQGGRRQRRCWPASGLAWPRESYTAVRSQTGRPIRRDVRCAVS